MRCRKCKSPMIIKENRWTGSKFWACSVYPGCKHTEPYIDIGKPYIIEDKQKEQMRKLKEAYIQKKLRSDF
jgi:ssDNA-binding Zn-finger/Zn-ribbon topoisomerase 1